MTSKGNNRIYRKTRVPMTEPIEHTLYELVKNQNDTGRKKVHPAKWYRDEVARILELSEDNNPSLRSYEERLKIIRHALREKDPLDNPWCIGHCLKHNIPSEVIPILIRIKKKLGNKLTIRRAKWIGVLYPGLKEIVENQFPDDTDEQDKRYALIPRAYAIRDKYASDMGHDIDTTDLDTLFFVYEDISEEAIGYTMSDNIFLYRPARKAPRLTPDDIAALQGKLGKLSKHELETFEGYYKAFTRSGIAGLIFMHEHPEDMTNLINKVEKAGG